MPLKKSKGGKDKLTKVIPPLVSCICITRNRRVFLRQAVSQWQWAANIYGEGFCELVILDGSDEKSRYLQVFKEINPTVRYYHNPKSVMSAGTAHNEACELAKGDIIIQWDDDDWQAPGRIRRQVQTLLSTPGDGFAFSSQYYWYHLERRQAAKARSWEAGEGSTGAIFAYWKDTWKRTPFQDVAVGEDIPFQAELRAKGVPMLDAKDPWLFVYIRHNQNGSALTNYEFRPEDTRNVREAIRFEGALDFYDGLSEILPVANWNHPNAPGSKVHAMNPLQQQWLRRFR